MQPRIDKTFVKIRTWTVLKVTLLILLIMAPVAASDWPQFHGGPEHTGASLSRALIINKTAWISNDLGAQPGSSVSLAEGKVYVNCVRALIGLDQHTGKVLWKFPFESAGDYAFGFTPIYHNGCIFFSADKSYCLNASDGSLIWSFLTPTGGRAVDGCPAADDGKVVVSDWDGHHYYLERTDSTPALAQGKVYLCGGVDGFSNLTTYCFDAATGNLVWKTSSADKIGDWRCSPAYAEGLIFAGKSNLAEYAGLCALNASSGEPVWSNPGGGTSPAIADGLVFSVANGKVYAFGDNNG